MTNKIKVLIAEEAADFRSGTPDFFEEKGYDAQFCEKNGNRVLENIDTFCPDVVLMDMFMSGSPIIQNGKLIGAVTHVYINDPSRGYAVFAESMCRH